MSNQILSYVNILDINGKLLAPAFTWMYNMFRLIIDKCKIEL